MQAWRIDALDPRAGLAFTSWRDFTLNDETTCLREAPCCLIAPPHFRPEPVTTRVLAWCANRGAFQSGLFIDEQEVPFATVTAVAEFVRRVYLRSGGGDTLNGGGAPVSPHPEDGGPELVQPRSLIPGMLGGAASIQVRIGLPRQGPAAAAAASEINALRRVSLFSEQGGETTGQPIMGEAFEWAPSSPVEEPVFTWQPSASPAETLGHAAMLLVREMLSRLPTAMDLAALQDWARAARALGWIIARLNLWDWLQQTADLPTLVSWTSSLQVEPNSPLWPQLERIRHEYSAFPETATKITLYLLFGPAPALDDHDWLAWLIVAANARQHGPGAALVPSAGLPIRHADPLDLLSLMPVPERLAQLVRSELWADVSLRDFLFATLGSPAQLLQDGKAGEDALPVLLLAACSLMLSNHDGHLSYGTMGACPTLSDLKQWHLADLLGASWWWLAGSLPRLAFPTALETAITAASSLRYSDEERGTGSAGPGSPTQPLQPGPGPENWPDYALHPPALQVQALQAQSA